jgi:hypothetical protein
MLNKILIIIIASLILTGCTEQGYCMNSAQRALQQYSYKIRTECKRLNSVRDRNAKYVNWENALICAQHYVIEERNIREQEARIRLLHSLSRNPCRINRWRN